MVQATNPQNGIKAKEVNNGDEDEDDEDDDDLSEGGNLAVSLFLPSSVSRFITNKSNL